MRRRPAVVAVLALANTAGHAAPAPRWLRILVPAPAGGGADRALRLMLEPAAALLSSRAIFDNRPGASGLVCARALARARPDGSTFGVLSRSQATLQQMGAPIDLRRDFEPVCRIANTPCFIAVAATSPHASLASLFEAIRGAPRPLAYGSGWLGSPGHIAFELLRARAGLPELTHVPFRGAGDSLVALQGGDIAFIVNVLPAASTLLRSGKLRVVAVTTRARTPQWPEVPTVAESGFPGYAYDAWSGLFAPAGTPAQTIEALADALKRATEDTALRKLIDAQGVQLDLSASPRDFGEDVARSLQVEAEVVRRLGLRYSAS